MPSFFNLVLDTTAPSGLSLLINNGAQYTTSTAVALTISLNDIDTAGYQMKIWGTSTATNEVAANWESYATSKNITLLPGDGNKTVSIKVRDNVGNESTITSNNIILDSAVPTIAIVGPDVTTVSKVTGYDTCAFNFSSDTAFVEYKVKVVPNVSSLEDAGIAIPTAGGSTNMSGTGTFTAGTPINCIIKGVDLESASSGDGTKVVKVFVKTAAGAWSVA